jgi:hypothetical protein
MARAADADDLPDDCAFELAFVALVMMTRARDEVMARERFLAAADGAVSLHS